MELVQQQGGRVNNDGFTALIRLFQLNPGKTDFSSNGFKLLWEKEKGINVGELKKLMNCFPELKERMIAAVPDARTYFK